MEINSSPKPTLDALLARMDRNGLLELYGSLFPEADVRELLPESRRSIITRILQGKSDIALPRWEDFDRYPPRRPTQEPVEEETLTRGTDQSVYWTWQKLPLESAVSLVSDDDQYVWDIPDGIHTGSLIVTALSTTPPLIVSLEIVDDVVEKQLQVSRLATFSNPIALTEALPGIEISELQFSQRLDNSTADSLLEFIYAEVLHPTPIYTTPSACAPNSSKTINEILGVISVLQRASTSEITCDICSRSIPEKLEIHLPPAHQDELRLEIQDHVDEVLLVCTACHEMAHQPSIQQLRGFARPACPDCGARNPREIIWGMPAGEPGDDVIIGGCILPPQGLPQWACRSCGIQYSVEKFSYLEDEPFEYLEDRV